MMSSTGPCEACTIGANSGTWPPPRRIAVYKEGWYFLHLCDICGTYWEFRVREAHPISEAEARRRYPDAFDAGGGKTSDG
jgi:hypothetical protein